MDHVYKAMQVMLLAVHQHTQSAAQPIQTILYPRLGTGVGKVPFYEAARQMALAY
jgi:O-acetyl-ADP-ribose deacetylase (regulator of RNase III)